MTAGHSQSISPGETSSAPTLRSTVQALRLDCLAVPEGELIGSEDQLLARHGVSRPTLRKAAALVAQEQLVQVRRGVGGGYIARRPTSKAVAHMAAIYLSIHDIGVDLIVTSMAPIRAELTRLAAEKLSEESRQEFIDFIEREVPPSEDAEGIIAFAKREREYGRILGKASGNAVLALFQDILFDLSANIRREQDLFLGRPDRMAIYYERRVRVIEAILDRDVRLAEMLSHRASDLNREWLADVKTELAQTGT